jgi:hypothetical protein
MSRTPVQEPKDMGKRPQKTLAELDDQALKMRRRAKRIERSAVLLAGVVGLGLFGVLWIGLLQDQFASAAEILSPETAIKGSTD